MTLARLAGAVEGEPVRIRRVASSCVVLALAFGSPLQAGASATVAPADVPALPGYPHVVPVAGLTGVRTLVENHAIQADGHVLSWGKGSQGQLGNGSFKSSASAVRAVGPNNIKKLVLNNEAVYALDAAGRVWSWGDSEYGLLGTGPSGDRSTPKLISTLPPITDVVADPYVGATFAIASDGRLFSWGRSQQCYWLGDGRNRVIANRPIRVAISTPVRKVISSIGAEFAITASGRVYNWGQPDTSGRSTQVCTPRPVLLPGLTHIRSIQGGDLGVFYALSSDGHVWSWGHDLVAGNVFGYATASPTRPKLPKLLAINSVAKLIPIDGVGVYALLTDGSVKAWGAGTTDNWVVTKRILGNGKLGGSAVPASLPGLNGARQIFPFAWGSAAAKFSDGSVRAWGLGRYDSFGTGSNANLLTPTSLSWATDLRSTDEGPSGHLLAALPSGAVMWGTLGYYDFPDVRTVVSSTTDVAAVAIDPVCGGGLLRLGDGTVMHVSDGPTGGQPWYCASYN